MCLAQEPQRSDAGEALAPGSRVKHSTTESLRSLTGEAALPFLYLAPRL